MFKVWHSHYDLQGVLDGCWRFRCRGAVSAAASSAVRAEQSVLTEQVLKPTGKGKQRCAITVGFLLADK